MAKFFVTTMNKKLFDSYGKDLLISYKNTGQKFPIYVYVEDDIERYPVIQNVIYVPLYEEEPECQNFVLRNNGGIMFFFSIRVALIIMRVNLIFHSDNIIKAKL